MWIILPVCLGSVFDAESYKQSFRLTGEEAARDQEAKILALSSSPQMNKVWVNTGSFFASRFYMRLNNLHWAQSPYQWSNVTYCMSFALKLRQGCDWGCLISALFAEREEYEMMRYLKKPAAGPACPDWIRDQHATESEDDGSQR